MERRSIGAQRSFPVLRRQPCRCLELCTYSNAYHYLAGVYAWTGEQSVVF